MVKTKAKTAAPQLPVPQTDSEATKAVAAICAAQAEIGRIEAGLKDDITALKKSAVDAASVQVMIVRTLTEGLRIYCEANRERLTNKRTKTIDFGTGTVSWRTRPASVKLRDKVEIVLERIKTLGFLQFIRTKEEIDKEAMIKEADLANAIEGVTVGSAGEEFIVGTEEPQLDEVAA